MMQVAISSEGCSVAFMNESGCAVLTYGSLKAWDADGMAVPVHFTQGDDATSGIGVVVDDANARYPITIDPLAQQQAYLKASNTGSADFFGYSVAVSGDTVVVGAYLEDSIATGVNGDQTNNSATDAGAAYVFVRSGTTWSQQAYLKASNTNPGDRFGESVAVSGDTVVVGAHAEDSIATGVNGSQADNTASSSGAAYVFVRSGTTWSQQAYLKASNTNEGDRFGESVAVSGDIVVVGAYLEDSSATGVNGNQTDDLATNSGAAYVFVRSGASWSQQAYLKSSISRTDDFFSGSVAVSGNTVVVGAAGIGVSASSSHGGAFVFVRNGTTWSQQAYLKASNAGVDDAFGYSVAVSGDTVVVGAYLEDSIATGVNGDQTNNSATDAGAAYVFVRSGTTWSQQAYLKGSNTGSGDRFGESVAVSGDIVVVGAEYEDSSATGVNGNETDDLATNSGAAYVFVRSGTTWSQQTYLKASNTERADWFGISVAVSGHTAVVGAYAEDSSATGVDGDQTSSSASASGAAYIFEVGIPTLSNLILSSGTLSPGFAPVTPDYTTIVANSVSAITVTPILTDSIATVKVNGIDVPSGSASQSIPLSLGDNTIAVLVTAQNGTATKTYTVTVTRVEPSVFVLSTAATVHGEIAGAGDYEQGAAATLTAAPAPGYVFTGWTGDASGSTNPLSLTMDADKTVGATFAMDLTDADSDGITAYDELVLYGTNPNLADSDGDGLSDAWEVGIGRFSIVPGTFTWQQAHDDAHAKGGELACFLTEDRWQRAVQSLGSNPFESFTGLWIGASDSVVDGTWVWVNGQAFSYAPWGTTRPSTTDGNSLDYMEVSGGAGAEIGKWYDRSASTVRDGYILEAGYATSPTLSDTDGDGFSDGVEIAAKLNPLLASSTPEGNATVSLKSQAGLSNLEFSFNAANGASYRIEGSTDLQNWNILEDGIIGQGDVVTRFYSTENQPKRYFRVRRN